MEKPQHSLRHNQPIMHPLGPLRRLIRHLARQRPTLHPHLQLPLDHDLIKLHMPLRRKQSPLNIHTLHTGMLTRAPDMDFRRRVQQRRGFWGGRVDDVVQVHLMEIDFAVCRREVEEGAAYVREGYGRVREFPFVVFVGGDFAA